MPHSHGWLNCIREAVQAHLMMKTSESALRLRFERQCESSINRVGDFSCTTLAGGVLYESLPRRVQQVIAVNGNFTSHKAVHLHNT